MVARNFFLLLLNNSRQDQAAVAEQNLHSFFAISVYLGERGGDIWIYGYMAIGEHV